VRSYSNSEWYSLDDFEKKEVMTLHEMKKTSTKGKGTRWSSSVTSEPKDKPEPEPEEEHLSNGSPKVSASNEFGR
jgi:hypothetical protein